MKTQSLAAPWSRVAAFGVALCFASMLLTTAHAATNADGVREEVVKFGDLNLSNPEGVKALYRRVHAAAERVCETAGSPVLYERRAARACVQGAMDRAIERINAPALTRYAAERKRDGRSPS